MADEEVLYGLSGDDVERLRRLLDDAEGTLFRDVGQISSQDVPRSRISLYLAKTTATISARATTVVARAGTTVSGTFTIASLASTADLLVGMTVSGTGIAAGSTVVAIDSASQVTISLPTTASATNTMTFTLLALGSGTIEIFGLIENGAGTFGLFDQGWAETGYNVLASTIASGTYVIVGVDPYTGRWLIMNLWGPADLTNWGVVTTIAQNFNGIKSFYSLGVGDDSSRIVISGWYATLGMPIVGGQGNNDTSGFTYLGLINGVCLLFTSVATASAYAIRDITNTIRTGATGKSGGGDTVYGGLITTLAVVTTVAAVSNTTTGAAQTFYICDTSAGAFTITLNTGADRRQHVRNNAGANNVTVAATSGSVNGTTTLTPGQFATYVCDGTNWFEF